MKTYQCCLTWVLWLLILQVPGATWPVFKNWFTFLNMKECSMILESSTIKNLSIWAIDQLCMMKIVGSTFYNCFSTFRLIGPMVTIYTGGVSHLSFQWSKWAGGKLCPSLNKRNMWIIPKFHSPTKTGPIKEATPEPILRIPRAESRSWKSFLRMTTRMVMLPPSVKPNTAAHMIWPGRLVATWLINMAAEKCQ